MFELENKPDLHTAQPFLAQFGLGGIVGFLAVIVQGEFRNQIEALGHFVVETGPDHGPDHIIFTGLPDVAVAGLIIAEINMGDSRPEGVGQIDKAVQSV